MNGFAFLPAALFLVALPCSTNAMERLPFTEETAKADLNEDGLDETIVKSGECRPLCRFKILAQREEKTVTLGEIDAKSLALGNAYSFGIRNILAFDSPLNDFDFTTYAWQPEKSQYAIKNDSPSSP